MTVPAEIVLRIIELTRVEPMWLLHGKIPKYREPTSEPPIEPEATTPQVVSSLLRTALQLLERTGMDRPGQPTRPDHDAPPSQG